MEKDAPAEAGAPKAKRRKVRVQEYLYEPELEGAASPTWCADQALHCIAHLLELLSALCWFLLCASFICLVCSPAAEACLLCPSSCTCLCQARSDPLPAAAGLYQRSLLKAFSSTVESARFSVVVVDAPNIRVDEYRDFWSAGQVSLAQPLALVYSVGHCAAQLLPADSPSSSPAFARQHSQLPASMLHDRC